MANLPHFDRPFRLATSSFAVVEQDSDEELENAASAIVSTESGSREESPDFGVADLPFSDPTAVTSEIVAAIREYEPRLDVEAEGVIENLLMAVNVEVE